MKKMISTVLALALSGGLAVAEKKPKAPKPPKVDPKAKSQPAVSSTPAVTVVGISVVAPPLGQEGDEVRPFSEPPGTEVALAVTIAPPFGIIALQGDPESLEMTGGGGPLEGPEWDSADLSPKGVGGIIKLRSTGLPSAGTGQVSAKGTLEVVVSPGVRVEKLSAVELEKDATLKLRGATVTVSEVESSDDRILVTLHGPTAVMKAIRGVRLRAGSGPVVEGAKGGWGDTGEDTFMLAYSFATTARAGALEVDLWQDPREIKLPFRVDAGVGLPPAPAGVAAVARPALDPLPAGTATGQLVVDGKVLTLAHAVAVSGPDTFDATKESFTVLLSEKPIPAVKVEGVASLEAVDDLLPEGLAMTVRQEDRMQSYRLFIRHPSAGKGMQQSNMLFAKERWTPLGPDRVAGTVKSSDDDKPSEMAGHQVQYRVRFNAPVRKRFEVEAPLVLAANATKLALGGGAPGKAWIASQCGALPVDPKDPKAVEAFLIKEGKMPTEQDLAEMSKEAGKPITKDAAMQLFSAMLEMGAAFRPKNCKVLGGSTDGKLAVLQVEAIVLDGKSRADAYMVKEGASWKFKKNGAWSAVQ